MGIVNFTKYDCPPEVFAEISKSLLGAGKSIRFNAVGDSMYPFIQNGDLIVVEPAQLRSLKIGDIIYYQDVEDHALLHRIIHKRCLAGRLEFQIQADNALKPGGWVSSDRILGRLTKFHRNHAWIRMDSVVSRIASLLILAQLKLNLNKYRRFRSGRNYLRCLPVFCKFL